MEYATVQSGDFTITSNAESADAMTAALETETDEQAAAADTGKLSAESAEEAAPPSPADAATSDTTTTEKKKTRESVQSRIDAATAKQREAERERDQLRAELHAAREAAKAPKREPEPAKPQPNQSALADDNPDDPEPQIEAFANETDPYTAHLRALIQWESRQQFRKAEVSRQQREHVQTVQTRTATAQAACVEKIRTNTNGDATFYDKLSKDVLNLRPVGLLGPNEQPTGQTAIADCILDSDVPDKLLVYFTEHADDFQRLSTLHPYQTIREMGRLEARLTAAPSGPASIARPISAAKPPIKPVGGSPSVTDDSDDDTDDLSEAAIARHIKRENAKDAKSARR